VSYYTSTLDTTPNPTSPSSRAPPEIKQNEKDFLPRIDSITYTFDEEINSIDEKKKNKSLKTGEEIMEAKKEYKDASKPNKETYLKFGRIDACDKFPSIGGIYIRQCYKKLLVVVMHSLTNEEGMENGMDVLLLGTPGIGN
jgi:hypothetical protein